MAKKIIIDANFPGETRVILLGKTSTEHSVKIEDIEYETASKALYKNNIYLAKVTWIEPSLQVAFIDFGNEKSGFLPFSEIHPDYYQIPVSDQKQVLSNLKQITPPKITANDLKEKPIALSYNEIIDNEEIDIAAIEKLIETKNDIELEVADTEIENISENSNQKNQNYKIQEVIKKGQILLVQVTKEERGNKSASFTTYISLAGKYCVLMPTKASQNGVSRKISNSEERKRIKDIIVNLMSENDKNVSSIIARTAAIGRTTLELKKDYDYLVRLWNRIREVTLESSAPCFIHEEEGIIQKIIRDMCDHEVKEVIIQGSSAYEKAKEFMRNILPSDLHKIKEYKGKAPIFTKYNVEPYLAKLYQPVVSLFSGGYIVINPTEALISIDVNSGRATSERNIEETALRTNLEAAKEISKQIKLRDLSGLLVIDFIDMKEARNRKVIERSLKEFLSKDRARIQLGSIGQFGLLEMSRQRMRPSFLESNSSICNHCAGKGIVRANESNSMLILRTIENEIYNEKIDEVNVYANISAVIYLLNNRRREITIIEQKYDIKLNFYSDPNANSDGYSIEKVKNLKKKISVDEQIKPALTITSEIYQESSVLNQSQHKWKSIEQKNNKDINKSKKSSTKDAINSLTELPKKHTEKPNEEKSLVVTASNPAPIVISEAINNNNEQATVKPSRNRRIRNARRNNKSAIANKVESTTISDNNS